METFMYLKNALSSGNSSVCRLCLSPDVALEPLAQDETGKYLVQKIFDCTSVQIMPLTGIASVLCADCKTRVEEFDLFRNQCIKNNKVLNEFATELSNLPLVKPENDEAPFEPEQQTDDPIFVSLNEDTATHEVGNINLDHTYSAKETIIANQFDNDDGLDLPEVKLEPDGDLSSEAIKEGDPLKQPTTSVTHEDIEMHIKEEENQSLKYPAPSTVQVLAQADLQLFQEPIERIHTEEPPFVCNICNDTFITRDTLQQHAKTHNKDKQHKCPHCSTSFAAHHRLVIHLRYHTGERPFECQVCHKAFVSLQTLNSHTKTHNKDQYYQCPQCPAKFAQAGKVPIHIRTHHTGEKPFVCKICNKAFAASFQLTGHMHKHNDKKRFVCHYCSAKFTYATTLETHISRTHAIAEIPSRPYQCKICNKSFKTHSTLIHHRTIHTHGRQYECSQCPAKFYDPSSLKIHIRFHTGERPYVCKVCDKAFYTSSHLKTHCRTHNKDEQYQCTYCPARFAQSAYLKIHIRRHTGERPFMCEICADKFKDDASLKNHIRRIHEAIPSKTVECKICNKVLSSLSIPKHMKTHESAPTKLKANIRRNPDSGPTCSSNVECNLCNKVLSCSSSLKKHKKTHEPKLEQDKKFQCPKCPSKFYESGALQRHIRHHTGERPYACKLCGKAFHTSTNLKTHSKTHNKDQQQ